jgi:hypothetical protein
MSDENTCRCQVCKSKVSCAVKERKIELEKELADLRELSSSYVREINWIITKMRENCKSCELYDRCKNGRLLENSN